MIINIANIITLGHMPFLSKIQKKPLNKLPEGLKKSREISFSAGCAN